MNLPLLAWDTDAVNNRIPQEVSWAVANRLTDDINK